MKKLLTTLTLFCLVLTIACNNSSKPTENNSAASASAANKTINKLSFKMDGVLWEADNEIMGIFHPKGYNKAVLMGGSKGPKNKDEQMFSLNLYGIEKEGEYTIQTNDPNQSVVQLANISNEEPMCGSLMGYKFKISLKKCANNPTVIEASFEGEITCNTDRVIKITEGVFYYNEL